MNTVKISVPHQLGREEAKRRVQGHMGQFRTQAGGLISRWEERWSGDAMEFTATVAAAQFTGRLVVEDKSVQVDVDLPWFLAALGSSVSQSLESNTRHLLEHCP